MESTHIDVGENKQSKSLLTPDIKIDIVKKNKKIDKQFSPLFRQVSSFTRSAKKCC